MKIKTSELSGTALDYAVALLLYGKDRILVKKCIRDDGFTFVITLPNNSNVSKSFQIDWAHCGPIIEREKQTVFFDENVKVWMCWDTSGELYGCGETPLQAAMRCYIAYNLGDEVEIPDELLKQS